MKALAFAPALALAAFALAAPPLVQADNHRDSGRGNHSYSRGSGHGYSGAAPYHRSNRYYTQDYRGGRNVGRHYSDYGRGRSGHGGYYGVYAYDYGYPYAYSYDYGYPDSAYSYDYYPPPPPRRYYRPRLRPRVGIYLGF